MIGWTHLARSGGEDGDVGGGAIPLRHEWDLALDPLYPGSLHYLHSITVPS